MIRDKVYIAGALNSDACGYIRNASRMIKKANCIMLIYGVSVYCPANDFLQGIVNGKLEYDDYFMNTQSFLLASDAMFVVPNSENSKGTQKEIELAKSKNIPVFYEEREFTKWVHRPIIFCIVGKSGSGKTTLVEYIQDEYGISMIESHTDRPKRCENETGHTFYSKESFDKLEKEDMIAYTEWQGNRYCCLKEDVKGINTYVIDESGVCMLKSKYGSDYKIRTIFIDRHYNDRVESVGIDRVERDNGKFFLDMSYYDYVISNDKGVEDLKEEIGVILKNELKLAFNQGV